MRGEHLLHVLLDLFTHLSWRSDRHNMGFQHVLKKKHLHEYIRVSSSPDKPSLYMYTFRLCGPSVVFQILYLFLLLFKIILRPRFEYCIQTRVSRHKNNTDKLERIRRRTTKLIQEMRDLRYDERQHDCGRTCLEMRRLSGHQIDFLKY